MTILLGYNAIRCPLAAKGGALPVTRLEIVEHVAAAFDGEPTARDQLLALACQRGARPAVLRALEELPHGPFRQVRDLWPLLPDMPLEPESAPT